MPFDSIYEAITEQNDSRWAFGTDFDEPLAGVEIEVPSGVDSSELAEYCLMLGDDALIMSHRLQQWCTWAPELEDEVAIANIALDLLGQARLLLAHAGKAQGHGHGEDFYAYFRDEAQFRNVRLVEPENGDFAHSMARLLIFTTWRLALFRRLRGSLDLVLAGIADKGAKELTYHRDYAAQWVIRLGDGTAYSHERMHAGLAAVWPFLDELFQAHEIERRMADLGAGVPPDTVREEVDGVLGQVLQAARLAHPEAVALAGVSGKTGRDGVHTEALGFLLAELHSVARAHPEASW